MPNYYVGSNVPVKCAAFDGSNKLDVTSATVSVWLPDDTQALADVVVAVDGNEASHLIPNANITVVGSYKFEFTLILSGGNGIRHGQGTFNVDARYP